MEQQSTRQIERANQTSTPSAAHGTQPSELLRQAQGWSAVARNASQRLEADAEAELRLRRNDSGQ